MFSGKTSQAKADASDAEILAVESQRSVDLVASLPQRLTNMIEDVGYFTDGDQLDNSPADKKHQYPYVYGATNADRTGWVETTFSSYKSDLTALDDFSSNLGSRGLATADHNPMHGAYTYSGTVVFQMLTPDTGPVLEVLISFQDFRVVSNGTDLTLNGSIDTSFTGLGVSPGVNNEVAKATLSVKDAVSGHTWLLSDFDVNAHASLDNAPITSSVIVTGWLTDATYGAVAVSTPWMPLHYLYNAYNVGPGDGGYLKLAGAGGTSVFIGSANYEFWSLAYDPSGKGFPTRAVRYSWATGKPDTAPNPPGSGPSAFAVVANEPTLSTPGTLDGRLSYGSTAGYLSYTWSVELGQPDGHPKFDDPHSAMPAFSASKAGEYLVKLVVSDGVQQAVDRVVVPVAVSASEILELPRPKSGPFNVLGAVGQMLTFDARITDQNLGDTPHTNLEDWTLTTPAGSAAVLHGADTRFPSFTPDVVGYYTLSDQLVSPIVINVGEPYQYSPSIQFVTGDVYDMVPYDLYGDGRDDLVYSVDEHLSTAQQVVVLRNLGHGVFATVNSFLIGLSTGSYLDIGDLNGDGKPDIAVDIGRSARLLTQQNDGTFVSGAKLTPSCAHNGIPSFIPVRVAKLASDSTGSVLYEGTCADGVHVFHNDGTGNFSDVAVIPTDDSPLQVGDVTGDGFADVITTSYSIVDPAVANMLVYPGKSDGTFGAHATYSLGSDVNPGFTTGGGGGIRSYFIGDMSGDGLPDVTTLVYSRTSVDDSLRFFDQQAGGTLVTPGVSVAVPSDANCVALSDVDGDGKLDLVYTVNGGIAVALQVGTRTFPARIVYPISDTLPDCQFRFDIVTPLQAIDLDGDGLPDLLLPDGTVRLSESPGQ